VLYPLLSTVISIVVIAVPLETYFTLEHIFSSFLYYGIDFLLSLNSTQSISKIVRYNTCFFTAKSKDLDFFDVFNLNAYNMFS
jgi:hypothetical protein